MLYSPGDTSEDVGSSSLEERLGTLSLDDLRSSVEHGLVVDLGSRGHHHSSSDGVEGVRGESGSGGDGPSESERGEEVTLKGSDEDNRLDGIVET